MAASTFPSIGSPTGGAMDKLKAKVEQMADAALIRSREKMGGKLEKRPIIFCLLA